MLPDCWVRAAFVLFPWNIPRTKQKVFSLLLGTGEPVGLVKWLVTKAVKTKIVQWMTTYITS